MTLTKINDTDRELIEQQIRDEEIKEIRNAIEEIEIWEDVNSKQKDKLVKRLNIKLANKRNQMRLARGMGDKFPLIFEK